MRRQFYVYIMADTRCRMLYVAATSELKKRALEHKVGISPGPTQNYQLSKLLYYEIWDTAEAATARAQQFKRWHREWKLNLIREINPRLGDLPME